MNTIIGDGASGCVYKPSLKCVENLPPSFYDNKVSKLMLESNANLELKQNNFFDKLDTNFDYHLEKSHNCKIGYAKNKDAIELCNILEKSQNGRTSKEAIPKKNKKNKKWSALIQPYGGIDLFQLFLVERDYEFLVPFLTNFKNMFLAVQLLEQNKYLHRDIKPANILYNPLTHRFNLIDFGLHRHMNTILFNENQNFNQPLEYIFISIIVFKKMREKENFQPICKNKLEDILVNLEYDCSIPTIDPYFNEKIYTGLLSTIESIRTGKITYNDFRNKSLHTFDSYSLGFTLMHVVKKNITSLPLQLSNELYHLAFSMIDSNLENRITIQQAISKYEQIIGLFLKPQSSQSSIKATTPKKKQTRKEVAIVAICKKEINPFTGRYNKTCKNGYIRNEKFKCVKESLSIQ
jgi:serine/threonine protein kinase